MSNPRAIPATTVAVLPTETTLTTLDVTQTRTVSIHVYNGDATQTFNGRLRIGSRSDVSTAVIPLAMSDSLVLDGIGPLSSRCVEYNCDALSTLAVVGSMSGAGANIVLAVRDLPLVSR